MTANGWRKRQIMQWIPSEKKEQQEQKPKQKPVVFFRTDNGWRKEAFEKTLVKNVPLDTIPPEPKPHVWFDFSNCDKYRSKEEFEKTLVPLDATSPQRQPGQESVAWEVQAQLRPLYIDGADLSLDVVEQLHQWARQCVTDEREECAKVCEDSIDSIFEFSDEIVKKTARNVCINLAKGIRARGNDA